MTHHHHEEHTHTDPVITEERPLRYWRSLEYRRMTQEYADHVRDEFKTGDSEITGFQRRDMLKMMGASVALAGVGVACRRPVEKIMPYTRRPEAVVPGMPNYFASVYPSSVGALGVLVESHEGRPTKLEGNPDHPANKGSLSVQAQASVLELYDPDRSRYPTRKMRDGRLPATWVEWDSFLSNSLDSFATDGGSKLAFVMRDSTSPTAARLIKLSRQRFPKAKWYHQDTISPSNTDRSAAAVFGPRARVQYDLAKARVIACIQADPFMNAPDALNLARGFAEGRKITTPEQAKSMNRLYVVESPYTVTGTNADNRLRLPVSETGDFVKALLRELFVVQNLAWPSQLKDSGKKAELLKMCSDASTQNATFIRALAKDLVANKGRSAVMIGCVGDENLSAAAHIINLALENLGRTFQVLDVGDDEKWYDARDVEGLTALKNDLNNGSLSTLVLLDVNPVYAARGKDKFADVLKNAKTTIHCGLYEDETALLCDWHLPLSHYLESWSDARSFDGTAAIGQPLIAPLHSTRSLLEILAQLVGQGVKKAYDLVQETWRSGGGKLATDNTWRKTVHDGLIAQTQYAVRAQVVASADAVVAGLGHTRLKPVSKDNLEIVFKPHYYLLDGRGSNSGWLQELPDPITKTDWGNVLLMSPKLAKEMGIKSGTKERIYMADVVEITVGDSQLQMPVFVMPGLPDYGLVTFFGYGREAAGQIGNGVGINVNPIAPASGASYLQGVSLRRTGKVVEVSTTQEQFAMNGDTVQEVSVLAMPGRNTSRAADVGAFAAKPDYAKEGMPEDLLAKNEEGELEPKQMTDSWKYTGNKWGMVIDLSSCIGCNACVAACQAENNIPVVGAEQVKRGRSMHWLRVDRYFTGEVENPRSVQQPVPCMHCENAPCEPVCPVGATVHDTEGLNAMAYNRCIGTRYCGNNCPYKVRHFNYFDFSNSGNVYVAPETLKRQELTQMQLNPSVTVRYRGVMEKCTYCTQRIQAAKMESIRQGGDQDALKDGAVTPACAQTCPTQAITFGNLNDPKSRVVALKAQDRNYSLLDELNTRPRTTYLAKLRNPNPELV